MAFKKLPNAEFEIMKAIWHSEEPTASPCLTKKLRVLLPNKDWKQQTILTMLVRLEKKGYLRSEKRGRERVYFPLISEEQYLKIELENFKNRFSGGTLSGFVKALYDGNSVSESEIRELKDWIEKM